MSNYLKIPIAKTEDSGTASATTADKLVEAGQNFLTTVTVGSIVWNTTDNTSATVTAIDSDTELSISADIMANTETYKILSVSVESGYHLLNDNAIATAVATSDIATTIQLSTVALDTVTINHVPNTSALSIVQDGMLANNNNTRPQQPFSTVEGGLNGLLVESVGVA
jgi:hypothetical protein